MSVSVSIAPFPPPLARALPRYRRATPSLVQPNYHFGTGFRPRRTRPTHARSSSRLGGSGHKLPSLPWKNPSGPMSRGLALESSRCGLRDPRSMRSAFVHPPTGEAAPSVRPTTCGFVGLGRPSPMTPTLGTGSGTESGDCSGVVRCVDVDVDGESGMSGEERGDGRLCALSDRSEDATCGGSARWPRGGEGRPGGRMGAVEDGMHSGGGRGHREPSRPTKKPGSVAEVGPESWMWPKVVRELDRKSGV